MKVQWRLIERGVGALAVLACLAGTEGCLVPARYSAAFQVTGQALNSDGSPVDGTVVTDSNAQLCARVVKQQLCNDAQNITEDDCVPLSSDSEGHFADAGGRFDSQIMVDGEPNADCGGGDAKIISMEFYLVLLGKTLNGTETQGPSLSNLCEVQGTAPTISDSTRSCDFEVTETFE